MEVYLMLWWLFGFGMFAAFMVATRVNYWKIANGCSRCNSRNSYDWHDFSPKSVHMWYAILLSTLFPFALLYMFATSENLMPQRKPKPVENVKDKYAAERDKRIAAYEKELGKL